MKEFKIYGEIGCNPDTTNFRNFMKEIENRINSDDALINAAKECNLEFANKMKEILNDESNNLFIGSMIAKFQSSIPRYSYLKNYSFNGDEYDVRIDNLERKFYLCKID